jgi:sugar phosphate isomerase/epimerase
MTADSQYSRRTFLAQSAWSAAALGLAGAQTASLAQAESAKKAGKLPYQVCTFVKYLQSMSFDDQAQALAKLGFDGIESTVRKQGQILPEQAVEKLPEQVAALKRHGLEMTIMASSINRADAPLTEAILRTAAGLGVKRYRMDYYIYDLKRPIMPQLKELKSVVRDLAALNRDIGIQAIYQNHAGAKYVGAGLWDLNFLLEDIPKEEIGIAYDIRHATVEGGLTWQTTWQLSQPHLAAVYVKDARWSGRKLEDGPLGWENGVVDPRFFKMLKASEFSGPVSLHVEYLGDKTVAENLTAIEQNFATLQHLLATS